jgi:hypothetical protein
MQSRKMLLGSLQGFRAVLFAAVLIGLAAMPSGVAGQQPASAQAGAAKTWRVRVKQNGAYFVTVRAKAIPLTQIAEELSRQLKAPVVLSRVMAKQQVTLDFENLPLETALLMIAPLPFVHYELQGGSSPICREVFLNAYNEPVPAAKLENRSVSFIMQGDTETIGDKEADPLRVNYRNGLLSITVNKQSLTAVLDRVATEMGVGFTMKQDTDDLVDLNFKEASLEDALSYFPPSVHVHVRKDIQRATTVPLLVEFAK